MRSKAWYLGLLLSLLLAGYLLTSCDEKATEPEDGLDVTNDNPHCGLVAGFVRTSDGAGLEDVTISIYPTTSARTQVSQDSMAFSDFMNFPNPFTSDTYFTYLIKDEPAQTVRISIYNLRQELLREFPNAPTAIGANMLYFDGLDNQQEVLPNGLYPCEVLALCGEDTTTVRIALSKNINIASEGGLQSYKVTTQSNGKYVIADVPLNILLQTTTAYSPSDSLIYPGNWPYIETLKELTELFQVSASKTGYTTVLDTVTLAAGGVTRLDFTLR